MNGEMLMKTLWRILIYILGLFCLAFSVTLAVSSNLGVIAGNTFPFLISQVTNISLGTCCTAVFFVYVLLQIVILRKDFKPFNLLQLVFSVLFGYFVRLTTLIIGGWVATSYLVQLLQLALSILLTGIGVVLYIQVDLLPMPPDCFLQAIIFKRPGNTLGKLRIIHDCVVVLISAVISYAAFSTILGIREGTLISAVFSGLAIDFFSKILAAPIRRVCFDEPAVSSRTPS